MTTTCPSVLRPLPLTAAISVIAWTSTALAGLPAPTTHLWIAGASLAASQDAAPAQTPKEEQPVSDPAAPKSAEDVLRGPKVPEIDVKSNRPFVEGAKDGEKLSKPVLEQRVYFRAIDLMAFEGELKEKVDALRVAFADRVTAYNKVAQTKRAELEAKRKAANPSQPPSEEFKREMNKIEAERPKLAELQSELKSVIGEDKSVELEKKFTEELKRVRAEQTRRTEEERKKKRAELEERKKQASEGKSKDAAPPTKGGDDEMKPNA